VEEEARIVREIVANVASGATLYAEAKRLNDLAIPSPGRKYRGRPRQHGAAWCHSTVRGIVKQGAYAGVYVVKARGGPIERPVPAIVEPALRQQALARLGESKRYSGGKKGRVYVLRGLVTCANCGTAYIGEASGRYHHYYACRKKRDTSDKRTRELRCPKVRADWPENLVWTDIRSFLEDPGEALQRVREQLKGAEEAEDLEECHEALRKRLAAKQGEKGRYVKLYAQGLLDDGELEVQLADLKHQVENLKMLLASVEADLASREEDALDARSTEAWLLALRENLAEVEEDTEEASLARRELARLLVERISVAPGEDGRPTVEITYRFGPPGDLLAVADGVQNSEEFARAHGRGGSEGLLRGHPSMSSYEVAVEREPEVRG
jgi:site-specific DNA recombinase